MNIKWVLLKQQKKNQTLIIFQDFQVKILRR